MKKQSLLNIRSFFVYKYNNMYLTLHGPVPISPCVQMKKSSSIVIAELNERRQIEESTVFVSAFSKILLGL